MHRNVDLESNRGVGYILIMLCHLKRIIFEDWLCTWCTYTNFDDMAVLICAIVHADIPIHK